jgi:hypothetical protein
MEYKEMRAELKEAGVKPVPLKNTEMYQLYIKENPDYDGGEPGGGKLKDMDMNPAGFIQDISPKVTDNQIVEAGEEYTYIGVGETPPQITKYMGIQTFTRGIPVMVTDKRILARIAGNASFVKGKVDGEVLIEQDELAKKRCDKIREEDTKIQIMCDRANRG